MLLLIAIPLLIVIVLSVLLQRIKHDKSHLLKHVVITGGSSGIGLAIAKHIINLNKAFAKNGSAMGLVDRRITLIARGKEKLELAKEMLEKLTGEDSNIIINIISLDVADNASVQKYLKPEMDKCHPTMLFNVAGTSISGYVESTPTEMYENLMKINYIGTVNVTRTCLPYLRSSGKGGAIAFTSSAAGQVGVFGYTAYSPSKFALSGFVEALSMEVFPDKVSSTIAFPPDTDTPGYKEEQKCKPKETDLISDAAGLFQAEDIAIKMVKATLNGDYTCYWGLEGWMLATLTCGMGPATSLIDVLCQIFLMGTLRLVSLFYLWSFRSIIAKCKYEREISAKVE